MDKFYVGDDSHKNKNEDVEGKITLDYLRQKIKGMEIFADVTPKGRHSAMVTVHKNVGTTMFMSTEFNDHFWLQQNSVKREDTGGVVRYHFVLD